VRRERQALDVHARRDRAAHHGDEEDADAGVEAQREPGRAVAAHHDGRPERKVDLSQDPEDEREADGEQRVSCAERQSVEGGLEEVNHAFEPR
jgi:hypothetical protein